MNTDKVWVAMPPMHRKIIECYKDADAIGKTKSLYKLRTEDGQKALASLISARGGDREALSLRR